MWRVLVFMAVVLVSTASSNAAPRFVTPAAPFVGSGLGTPIRCPNPSGPIVKCDYTQTCCEIPTGCYKVNGGRKLCPKRSPKLTRTLKQLEKDCPARFLEFQRKVAGNSVECPFIHDPKKRSRQAQICSLTDICMPKPRVEEAGSQEGQPAAGGESASAQSDAQMPPEP